MQQGRPGLVPAGVRAGRQRRGALVGGQPVAGIQQQAEVPHGVRAWPHRAELDVTVPAAGLGSGADVADGHALQGSRVADEDDVPQALVQHRLDLTGDIESRVDRVGQLTHGREGTGPGPRGQVRHPGPRVGRGGRRDRHGHDRGEEPGPEAEPLVQADMHGALREGEQAGVAGAPGVEQFDGGLHEPLGDPLVPA